MLFFMNTQQNARVNQKNKQHNSNQINSINANRNKSNDDEAYQWSWSLYDFIRH